MNRTQTYTKLMPASHEAFIAIRDLSRDRGGMFRWYQFRDTLDAIIAPKPFYRDGSFDMTVGNLLRGLYRSRMIIKVKRGLYQITAKGYATPGVSLAAYKMYQPPISTLGDRNWNK